MQRAIAIPQRHPGRIRWNQDYADVALALALTVLALSTAVRDHYRLDAVSISLLILQTLPIAMRRRNPMRILVITGSAITLYSLLGYLGANGVGDSNGAYGVVVAFYTVAANEPRRRAMVAAALTAGGVLVSFAAYAAFDSIYGWTANLSVTYLSFGLAWLIGDNLRVRRAYTRQLEERAVQLEREHEEQAALAVSQERAHIARELHDVVAHHVSVMVVQAAGARRVVDKDPGAAREALEAVELAGRTALDEMRRMLEVLRTDEAGVGPQPGLGELERLVGQVRETGLPVELTVEGRDRTLPGGMDLAAYRIIQEALTNTVKHAGRATANVTVRYEPEALDIAVTDDGRGAAAALLVGSVQGGHGLIGMQERVALYEGTLETGPVFPGGYRVHARFPLEPAERGSLATCCDEESALSAVAAAALRDRLERGVRNPSAPVPEPEPLVKRRVVPPLIGRVVPPHSKPRAATPPPARPTARPSTSTSKPGTSRTRRSEP
jgi:signal transduction histidine kinase